MPRGKPEAPSRRRLWRRQSDEVNRRLLRRWLPDGSLDAILKTDLFDELVGDGLFTELTVRARRVVGVDVSHAVVDGVLQCLPEIEALRSDVRALPFADDSFDCVVSNSTLDHLDDRGEVTAALREIRRVLRDDGRLILTLDNPLNPIIAIRRRLPSGMARAVRRVSYTEGWTCGPSALPRLLYECGFHPVEQTAILHAPRFIVSRLDHLARTHRHRDRLIRAALGWERLESYPSRYLTGHFLAVLAEPIEDLSPAPQAAS